MELRYQIGYTALILSTLILSCAANASLKGDLLSDENDRRPGLGMLKVESDLETRSSSSSAETTPRPTSSGTASDDSSSGRVRVKHHRGGHRDLDVERAVKYAQRKYQQRHPSADFWAFADIENLVRAQYMGINDVVMR